MRLSIVATLYHSAPYLEEFHRRVSETARSITEDYEIILVNDGSPDASLERALALHEKDERVKVIDLSRNFGHHKAMMTGLSYAGGDLVFLIDCDLEEEPELLERFYGELNADPVTDVVYGVQRRRKGSLWRTAAGAVFYRLFNLLSETKIPVNLTAVRLMKRAYVEALTAHRDREVFIDGLWSLAGFNQKAVTIDKGRREGSTYDVRRKTALFVNAITSFTSKPLVYIFYVGLMVMLVSMAYIALLVYRQLVLNYHPPGYSSIVVSIWFLGGLTLCAVGIVGIYLAKVFMETKDRPYTIVRAVHDREKKRAQPPAE